MQPAKGARTTSDRPPRGPGNPPGSSRGPPRDHFWKDFETILGSLLMSFFFKFLDEFWNVFQLRSSTFSINTDINTTASTSTIVFQLWPMSPQNTLIRATEEHLIDI